jgi:hypothetical protein
MRPVHAAHFGDGLFDSKSIYFLEYIVTPIVEHALLSGESLK